MEDNFTIANKNYKSRLIIGTGKYKNFEETAKSVKASGADIVTVAVRRVNISNKSEPLLMDYLDPKTITYLPNTAGCYTSDEALRTLRLAREMGNWRLVKLEVLVLMVIQLEKFQLELRQLVIHLTLLIVITSLKLLMYLLVQMLFIRQINLILTWLVLE